jgi:hypothetical protein
MLRLLRPGFHSGTVPKLFAKLRRAHRRDNHAAVHKRHAGLHHVEEEVRHFVERECLHLLRQSKAWGGARVELRRVGLATNRIRVELACPEVSDEEFALVFDQRSGWLVAGVERAGWTRQLSEGQAKALWAALAGLYKLAGVDLTREQVAAELGEVAYDVNREGLEVWRGNGVLEREVRPLGEEERLLFRNVPVTWERWVQAWDRDRTGQGVPADFLAGVRLLPIS